MQRDVLDCVKRRKSRVMVEHFPKSEPIRLVDLALGKIPFVLAGSHVDRYHHSSMFWVDGLSSRI